jgi:hypothetical protein
MLDVRCSLVSFSIRPAAVQASGNALTNNPKGIISNENSGDQPQHLHPYDKSDSYRLGSDKTVRYRFNGDMPAKRAVQEDGAEIIIMGCAGMAGYAQEIEQTLKEKVLDPSAVALKTAETMADLGLTHSKVGLFATPPKKIFR